MTSMENLKLKKDEERKREGCCTTSFYYSLWQMSLIKLLYILYQVKEEMKKVKREKGMYAQPLSIFPYGRCP